MVFQEQPASKIGWHGGGEMGRRVRSHPWSSTPLGVPESWSESLQATVNLVLASPLPMNILWGTELIQIYNDAYRALLTGGFVAPLGRAFGTCYPQMLNALRFSLDAVLDEGESTQIRGLPFERTADYTSVYSPLWDGDRIGGILLTAVVSSDRVHNRQPYDAHPTAFQKHEQQLRSIVDAVPVLISYIDAEQRYRFNNKTYEIWFGQGAQQVEGMHIRQVVGEAAYAVLQPYLEMALSGHTITYERDVPYQGAGVRSIKATYIPQFGDRNTVEGIVALVTDVTDYKQLEAKQRWSEARIRRLMDSNMIGVIFANFRGNITEANEAFLNLMGYTQKDLQSGCLCWQDLTPPEWLELDHQKLQEISQKGACIPYEKEYIRKDGSRVPILVGAALLPDSQEDCVCFILDLTERKHAEAALHEAETTMRQLNEMLEQRVQERTAQLEAANRELEAFSYSVSHDLRAPLRHIDGFVDLLKRRLDPLTLDETSQRYLKTIASTTKQAGILIDDLLSFSRMGRAEIRWMTINVNQLVQEVKREMEQETQGRTIHWQIATLPTVKADLAMLRQVIRNLLSNAVKYTRDRTPAEITIGCDSTEQEDVFFVRDNGIGFNMQYSHKLFGIFQRLHSDPSYEGTGIGLANVQRIVHRHGGRTWAEGMLGVGATFYFSLPKHPESALQFTEKTARLEPATSGFSSVSN